MKTTKSRALRAVTPHSSEPYYPLFLANGDDSVVIDYSGSCFVSHNSHSHFEQHQGSPTGWYKGSYRHKKNVMRPIFSSGVQVMMNGAPAEPEYYTETFDPFEAKVESILEFDLGVKVRIEGFLTDRGIRAERVSVLECPGDVPLGVGFLVMAPSSEMRVLTLRGEGSFSPEGHEDEISFDYTCDCFCGSGFLRPDKRFDEFGVGPSHGMGDAAGIVGMYKDVKKGFSVSAFSVCVDSESEESRESLRDFVKGTSYDALLGEHARLWREYSDKCRVTLPDENLQYLYDISRYVIRACQNRKTGLITCGWFPNLWGGGVCCGFDASLSFEALLSSGNIDEAREYIGSFALVEGEGRRVLEERGIEGTTFLGWQTCLGAYVGPVGLYEAMINRKPMYSAFSVTSAYYLWKKDRSYIDDNYKRIMRDYLTFLENNMIIDKGDYAYIIPVKAGTEIGYDVKIDSFTQMLFGVVFLEAAEMLGCEEYAKMGDKLMKGLASNYTDEGVLLPFENARFLGGLQLESYLLCKPSPIDFINIEKVIEAGRTPWGIDNDQTSETYRHWPWNDTKISICAAREGRHEIAMDYLLHSPNGMAATGALPEKIRIDGAAVGYWYTSTHSLQVMATNDALAFDRGNGEVCIAYGIDGRWQSFACEGISLDDGVSIGYEVKDGAFVSLAFENKGREPRELTLCFNPDFRPENAPENVLLPVGKTKII